MIFRSAPRAQFSWFWAILAVALAVLLPALMGTAFLFISDTPLSGPPKDGRSRSGLSHLTILATVLGAAPAIAWIVAPIAVPLARVAAIKGWAGMGSAIGAAIILGLPLVSMVLRDAVSTTGILPHIVAALVIQGAVGWIVVKLPRRNVRGE